MGILPDECTPSDSSSACRLLSGAVAYGTRVFWLLIAVLLTASLYFGAGIEARRGPETSPDAPQPSPAVTPESGH